MSTQSGLLPTVKLGDTDITRLIIGGNPFSGNSHVSAQLDADMEDFFTTDKIKETLFRCMECGINTMQLRGDRHITRIINEFRAEGGKLNWIAMTTPEIGSFEGNIANIMKYSPSAIYHHGSVTDIMFKKGEYAELERRIEIMRRTGLPIGIGTHLPEVVAYADEHNWKNDFFMTSVYNIILENRVSSAITGKANEGEPFEEEDIPLMYAAVRATTKTCLAFKILGASRRCATQDSVRFAFNEAFENIKPTDAVVVGVYPRKLDEVALNAGYVRDAISRLK